FVPARTPPGVMGFGLLTACCLFCRKEPVRSLPTGRFTKIGALRGKLIMHGTVADAARGGELPVREMVGIEEAERLRHARYDEAARRLPVEHPAYVDIPKVEWRGTADDPFCKRLAGAGGRLDADGVEAAGNEESSDLRTLPQHVAVVVGKALRPVEERAD